MVQTSNLSFLQNPGFLAAAKSALASRRSCAARHRKKGRGGGGGEGGGEGMPRWPQLPNDRPNMPGNQPILYVFLGGPTPRGRTP